MNQDGKFMEIAIKEAYKAKGKTLPNPAVGAVIVKSGNVVSTGYHKKVGLPHAEAVALKKAGKRARGATLYVTLEPCNHYGRTPPCSEKIIKAGIRKVVVGIRDPNPVARGGVERLRSARIELKVGVLKEKCFELIDDFIVNLKGKKPFLSLKLASTLDGMIADKDGSSKWITSSASRKVVHRLRSYHNAVMVGIGTVLKDDPLLNVREAETDVQPKAVVVDQKLRIPTTSRLLKERANDLIILTGEKAALSAKANDLKHLGVTIVPVPDKGKKLNLIKGLETLKEKHDIYSIMCEGGSRLASSLLKNGLIDKFYLFYAPKFLGGMGISMFTGVNFSIDNAYPVKLFSTETVGSDLLVKAYSPKLG